MLVHNNRNHVSFRLLRESAFLGSDASFFVSEAGVGSELILRGDEVDVCNFRISHR